MTYLQPHRRPYQRFAHIIGATIAGIILICIVLVIFAPHFLSSFFTSVARPFWRMEFSVASGSLRSPEQLLIENELLKNELAEMKIALEMVDFIQIENNELKILLGRGGSPNDITSTSTGSNSKNNGITGQKGTLAAVLKRPPLSPYDELIIDIGRDHSVSTSSLVYAAGNILIGRVIDVLENTSKIKLFSSPGEKYDILVGSNHTPATALGRGGGQYEAQVSSEVNVKEGDFVINPSLNDRQFGIVIMVISDPTQPFETILFAPQVNVYELRWVIIK